VRAMLLILHHRVNSSLFEARVIIQRCQPNGLGRIRLLTGEAGNHKLRSVRTRTGSARTIVLVWFDESI
jgi:hypothetical protein